MTKQRLGAIALLVAAVLARGAETQQPAAKPKTPEQKAAEDLLERYRREYLVKQQLIQQTAAQHFRTGKTHFELGAWEAARKQFEQALALAPSHKDAQTYLAKTRGILGVKKGDMQAAIQPYIIKGRVVVDMQKMELRNLFEQGKAQYERGEYEDAIETFTRVGAMARYLAPVLDTSREATGSAVYIHRAQKEAEDVRRDAEKEKLQKARDEAERSRDERRGHLDRRSEALFRQAQELFASGRYNDARVVCDALLLDDPTHGAVEVLREKTIQMGRDRDVQRVLARRDAEEQHLMRQLDSWKVPQAALVHLTPEARKTLLSRNVESIYGGEPEARPAWETRLRAALQRKVSFDFIETPLGDVLGFLSQLVDQTIVLDTEAIRDEHPTVTLRVSDMRLEAALGWICKLTGLKYGLRDEAIFVSSGDRFADQVILRMYDVTDLTLDIPNFKGNQKALSTGEGHGGEDGGANFEHWFEDEDEEEDDKLTGEQLIKFIRRVFASEPWDPVEDGEGDLFSGFLGDPAFTLRQKGDTERLDGKALADIVAVTVGGRTFLAARSVE
jgi:tetratricopeptide (TPR) repeat protein